MWHQFWTGIVKGLILGVIIVCILHALY